MFSIFLKKLVFQIALLVFWRCVKLGGACQLPWEEGHTHTCPTVQGRQAGHCCLTIKLKTLTCHSSEANQCKVVVWCWWEWFLLFGVQQHSGIDAMWKLVLYVAIKSWTTSPKGVFPPPHLSHNNPTLHIYSRCFYRIVRMGAKELQIWTGDQIEEKNP